MQWYILSLKYLSCKCTHVKLNINPVRCTHCQKHQVCVAEICGSFLNPPPRLRKPGLSLALRKSGYCRRQYNRLTLLPKVPVFFSRRNAKRGFLVSQKMQMAQLFFLSKITWEEDSVSANDGILVWIFVQDGLQSFTPFYWCSMHFDVVCIENEMHFIPDWRSFLYFLLVLFQHWNETCLQNNNIVATLKKSLLEWISACSLVKHCVQYTFWDRLEVKIRFIPQIRRQNISQHAAEIILQTQRVFFLFPSFLSLLSLASL